eukprot:2591-Eustigmatos_ZCMA.PRE.1
MVAHGGRPELDVLARAFVLLGRVDEVEDVVALGAGQFLRVLVPLRARKLLLRQMLEHLAHQAA